MDDKFSIKVKPLKKVKSQKSVRNIDLYETYALQDMLNSSMNVQFVYLILFGVSKLFKEQKIFREKFNLINQVE